MYTNTQLTGYPCDSTMIAELNHRLKQVIETTADNKSDDPYEPNKKASLGTLAITHMSAMVRGKNAAEATLDVELLLEGFNFSNIDLSFPLPGNNSRMTVSKSWELLPVHSVKAVIKDYWQGIANLLTYVGDKKSIAHSSIFNILSGSDIHATSMQTFCYVNPVKGANHLFEITADSKEITGCSIVVAVDGLGNEAEPDKDLGSYIYGVESSKLDPNTQKKLIELCRNLATYNRPRTMSVFVIA